MPRRITTAERRVRLAVRHRLVSSARVDDDLVAVARSVVVLHATDPSTVVLSAMARMREPDAAAVEVRIVPRFPGPLDKELSA